MRQFAGFILPVRVHHGHTIGQGFAAEVVIQDDHVCALGGGDGAVGQRAAIHADYQVVITGKVGHRLFVGAVTFVDAVRDIDGGP